MQKDLATKARLLDEEGYFYNFDRELYVNRRIRKAFSIDFIEEHDEAEIEERIRRATDKRKWQFYFNSGPSEAVKRELERVLG